MDVKGLIEQKTKELGLTITSGARTKEENDRVGGSPTSYHLKGTALDIAGDKKKLDELHSWARGTGLFVENLWQTTGHYDHVHLAWNGLAETDPAQLPTSTDTDTGGILTPILRFIFYIVIVGVMVFSLQKIWEDV